MKCFIKLEQVNKKGILLKLDFEKAFDKVSWEFLLEVSAARGFDTLFINWIKDILISSKTCVSFNGSQGKYFPYKKGLRQGDHLSSLLLDLVANTLNKILNNAQIVGFISGLGNATSKTLNLQFADDTSIFIEAQLFMIEHQKYLLLGLEHLSGLKINFHKSAIVPLNITHDLTSTLASQLGC